MKRFILSALVLTLAVTVSYGQKTKAEKEALAAALYEKAVAAITAKDFVIIPDQYQKADGTTENSNDDFAFISYENGVVYLQGSIVAGNNYTNRTSVSDFKQETDKKGNTKVTMKVTGSAITAKVEISVKKGGNYADVIVTPTSGSQKVFSGELLPRGESKYRKRPNEV